MVLDLMSENPFDTLLHNMISHEQKNWTDDQILVDKFHMYILRPISLNLIDNSW